MRLILAILLLQISPFFACPNVTSILTEKIFANIIADAQWQLMYKYRPHGRNVSRSLDPMVDTEMYTEFRFAPGFPPLCHIDQQCSLPLNPRAPGTIETMIVNRTAFLTATASGRGLLLTFAVFRTERDADPPDEPSIEMTNFFSYVVYKYVPYESLVLFTCEPRFGLLILRNIDGEERFLEGFDIAAVLEELGIDEISANSTEKVYLYELSRCRGNVRSYPRNCQVKSSQNGAVFWWTFLLQIFWNLQKLKNFLF